MPITRIGTATTITRRRGSTPPGTIIDLSGVTFGEPWGADALDADCANTSSFDLGVETTPPPANYSLGQFDWGSDGGMLITGSDQLVLLHRTETIFGSWYGDLATESFTAPSFAQAPDSTTALTGTFQVLAANQSQQVQPAFFGQETTWYVDVSVGPATADGVPGAVLASVSGSVFDVGFAGIPMSFGDPFDPSWPTLVRTELVDSTGTTFVFGDLGSAQPQFAGALEIDTIPFGGTVMWGGATTHELAVYSGLTSFTVALIASDGTISHVIGEQGSGVMLPREALAFDVYTAAITLGSDNWTTTEVWPGQLQLIPF
jgi:hypothetical protein